MPMFRGTKSAPREPKLSPPPNALPALAQRERTGDPSLREPNFAPFPTLALWGPTQPSLYNETTMWLSKLTLEIFLDSEYYNYDYIDLK
jgi:hypothetical protein